MKILNLLIIIFFITSILLLSSCSSTDITKNLSAEERFELGKSKFDNEDYLEAISEFEIVKLQYPGSSVADDAQFYLAESHFKKEEYLIAAQEYRALKRNFPASSLVPLAQYKIGLCYYLIAPKSYLDQEYTFIAIDEFQTFVEYYPTNELAADASAKIRELNTRLAKKLFDTAELYMILEYYKSATFYYNTIIEKYYDTQYAEPAWIGKIKSLIMRKKYADAKTDINKFLNKFQNSDFRKDAEDLRTAIESQLKTSEIIDKKM